MSIPAVPRKLTHCSATLLRAPYRNEPELHILITYSEYLEFLIYKSNLYTFFPMCKLEPKSRSSMAWKGYPMKER